MTDSRQSTADGPLEDDELLLEQILAQEEVRIESTDVSEADSSNEFLLRIQRTQSLLKLVGQIGTTSTEDPALAPTTTPADASADAQPPARIGRFEIQGELGRGGCGIVFRALDPKLNRIVALKVPRPGAMLSADMRQRFLREALAAAVLDHPNITAIFEAGEDQFLCYTASALCEGPTLDAWLRRRKTLPDTQLAARIAMTLAHAVHHAHSRGVMHRDLKPGNVILTESDSATPSTGLVRDSSAGQDFIPRLTDFGLARLEDWSGQSTATGAIVGTFNYMAPEQAEGRGDITTAVDVYGLGAILFELLAGRPPHQAASHTELLYAMRSNRLPSIRRLRPEVPMDLETICLKCLRSESSERYASAAEVAEELQRFLSGEPIHARRATLREQLRQWSRRRPLAVALTATSALFCLILLIGSVIAAWMLLEEKEATETQLTITNTANRELKAANRAAETQMVQSLLAQAGRARISGRAGQRVEAIAALEQALEITDRLQLPRETRSQIRDEMIACLALPDLTIKESWPGYEDASEASGIAISRDTELYARCVGGEAITIRRMSDNGELNRIPIVTDDPGKEASSQLTLRFSADASKIATVGRMSHDRFRGVATQVWDVDTGEILLRVASDGEPWYDDVDFSPDGRHVAIGFADGSVRRFATDSGDQVGTLSPDKIRMPPRIVRFSPEHQLLAVARSHFIEIWAPAEEILLKSVFSTSPIRAIEWTPDGNHLVWTTRDGDGLRSISAYGNPDDVHQLLRDVFAVKVAFHPNGNTVAVAGHSTTTLYDLPSERKLLDIDGLAVMFDHVGDHLCFGLDGRRTGRWAFTAAEECRVFHCPDILIEGPCLDFGPSGTLAVCTSRGVQILDTATGDEVGFAPGGPAHLGQFLSDGKTLITLSLYGAQAWPVRPGALLPPGMVDRMPRRLTPPDAPRPTFGVINADETELIVRFENDTGMRISLTNEDADPKPLPDFPYYRIFTDAQSRWCVTNDWDGNAILRDGMTFARHRDLNFKRARAEFSRDGDWLTVGNAQEYRTYETGSWREVLLMERNLVGHGLGATAYTPDSTGLAVADSIDTVRLFSTSDWTASTTLTLPVSSPAFWLTFNDDHSKLAACSSNGCVCLWDLELLQSELTSRGVTLGLSE